MGLNSALHYKTLNPTKRVIVLEKGSTPIGASIKNAGIACYGSVSELLMDLETHTEDELLAIVESRWKGLRDLRFTFGDEAIGYEATGGFEIFNNNDFNFRDKCLDSISSLNDKLKPITNLDSCYTVIPNIFNFPNISDKIIRTSGEGLINTGKLINAILKKTIAKGVEIWFNMEVLNLEKISNSTTISLNITNNYKLNAENIIIATNTIPANLLPQIETTITPNRAQVLITKPLDNINFRGGFHYDRGYYYFRPINNRILFGGGRNLDFEKETTDKLEINTKIHDELEKILKEIILPNTNIEIEERWCGIMGMGNKKSPTLGKVGDNIYYALGLGGIGIATGTTVGKNIAKMVML